MAFKKIEKEIIERISSVLGEDAVAIILYGSVARNEATEESDIDIAVLVKEALDEKTRDELLSWCVEIDIQYDCVMSVIDIENDKFEMWKNTHPFYKNVNEEGVVLWKAA